MTRRLALKQATPPGLPRWLAGFCTTRRVRVNEQVVQRPVSTGTSPVGFACLRTSDVPFTVLYSNVFPSSIE